jgi:hypothetical protein
VLLRSEQELEAFRQEKEQFEHFIRGEISKFKTISRIARQRIEKRERDRNERDAKVQKKVAARIDRLSRDMQVKEKEAAAMQQSLESVNERLRYHYKVKPSV